MRCIRYTLLTTLTLGVACDPGGDLEVRQDELAVKDDWEHNDQVNPEGGDTPHNFGLVADGEMILVEDRDGVPVVKVQPAFTKEGVERQRLFWVEMGVLQGTEQGGTPHTPPTLGNLTVLPNEPLQGAETCPGWAQFCYYSGAYWTGGLVAMPSGDHYLLFSTPVASMGKRDGAHRVRGRNNNGNCQIVGPHGGPNWVPSFGFGWTSATRIGASSTGC